MRKVLYLINSLKNGGPVNMLYSLCKYLDNTQYKIYVMALKKCDINARDFSNLNGRIFKLFRSDPGNGQHLYRNDVS